VFLTSSRRDFFYRANLNFLGALHRHQVPFETHFDHAASHTWQQDSHHPASGEVYERLQGFVKLVTSGSRTSGSIAG
jgi:hypothetical protein